LLVVVGTHAFGRAVIVKLTADGEFLWARTIEVFSNGVDPEQVLEDEGNGDLYLTAGNGTAKKCMYWLSSTGELLGSSMIRDIGWGYLSDLHWIEISSGEATAVAAISLDPYCLYPWSVGLAWLHGPAELPLSCGSEPLPVVFGDHPGELDTLVPFLSSPLSSTTETSLYQPTSLTTYQWDFCTITNVGSVPVNDDMAVLWPDPLHAGEPLHVSSAVVVDPREVRLLDDAGRALPCSLQQNGTGRYVLDTKALTPGHYTLVLGTLKGAVAKAFVVLK
jgi:hypothetical protein